MKESGNRNLYPLFERGILRRLDSLVGGTKRNHELAVRVLEAAERLPFGLGLKALSLIATHHDETTPNEKLQVAIGNNVTFDGEPVKFKVPVMVGAGFAESGAVVEAMGAVGFGGVEAGTYTLRPVERPGQRVYIPEDTNVVVHNIEGINPGARAARQQLERYKDSGIPVGANIGVEQNENPLLIPQTLAKTAEILSGVSSYLAINASTLRNADNSSFPASALIQDSVIAIRQAVGLKPIFIKLDPGMPDKDLERVIKLSMDLGLGVIAANGTKNPDVLKRYKAQPRIWRDFRVSGDNKQLYDTALRDIGLLYQGSGGELFIMGSGGVNSADRQIKMHEQGAWITQVKSAIRTKGLGLAREITDGLDAHLTQRGMQHVGELVGSKFRDKGVSS